MKHIVLLSLFLGSFKAFASISWENQTLSASYTTSMTIPLALDSRSFRIDRGTELKLIEIESLNMLKVYLHKYKVTDCPSRNLETDLELVQVSGKAVGVNLVRGCVLEVYIERADYSAKSFVE
ncbi:MAG: hypothetical protein CME65_11640 [Halobacteriovoraceae bacterium]|nr:hypothetical protein [Halobacteriovoraceae bacterium]|tara:strand:+ start:16044 stop:16412 length:369 start_codon:yes stop_codon:yes gene_type:complete